ncbi:hypothetical protein [Undibacterium sp.]|uniref:hypothetical protein n=1 Tax=Undibacterium sp. TaxID=1914977 RepID=UPI00374FE9FC
MGEQASSPVPIAVSLVSALVTSKHNIINTGMTEISSQNLVFGGDIETRQVAYRVLFRSVLEEIALDVIRLSLQ